MLLPAMRELRTSFTNALITAAASTGICELLAAEGLADRTIDLGAIVESSKNSFGAVKRFFRLTRETRQRPVDLVIDFSPRTETQIARWLTHRGRVLTPSQPLEFLERLAGRIRTKERARSSRYKQVLGQFGIKWETGKPILRVMREESIKFEKLLERDSSAAPLVILFSGDPGCSISWPPEKFAETAHLLTNSFGIRIVAVDSPSDRSFSSRLSGLLPARAIVLRQPNALQIIAALARSSLLITDDPGLATAVIDLGTPTIELRYGRGTERVAETHVAIGQAAPDAAIQIRDAASELLVLNRTSALFQR